MCYDHIQLHIILYLFHITNYTYPLTFRLVYDRETGKPKGYGFCEYKDTETAQSAMRNLNGTEIHGRQLRVDSAASQKGPEDPRGNVCDVYLNKKYRVVKVFCKFYLQ